MNLRTIALAALLTVSGVASAQDLLYTYTGNLFTTNNITAEPSRLVAHFVFDFDNSPQAAEGIYTIKHWDISAAGLKFGPQYAQTDAYFNFKFADGNVSEWGVWVLHGERYFSGVTFNSAPIGAYDLVLQDAVSGPSAWSNTPGVWTVAAVPEPATWLMLGAGAVMLLGARARQGVKKNGAKV